MCMQRKLQDSLSTCGSHSSTESRLIFPSRQEAQGQEVVELSLVTVPHVDSLGSSTCSCTYMLPAEQVLCLVKNKLLLEECEFFVIVCEIIGSQQGARKILL